VPFSTFAVPFAPIGFVNYGVKISKSPNISEIWFAQNLLSLNINAAMTFASI